MTRKKRRIVLIGIGAFFLISASVLVGVAMRDTIVFFFSPSELADKVQSPNQRVRVGGLVEDGTVTRGQGEEVTFAVTDGATSVKVTFTGVLPDLFREGQGVVAEGYLRGSVFQAEEILAKHDENYMPKEVVDALKEQGVFKPES